MRDTSTAASGKFYQAMASRPAYYDLSTQPASWDFWMWLTFVRKLGANKVVFNTDKPFKYKDVPQATQKHLFDNVVLPICDLWGIPYEFGEYQPEMIQWSHVYERTGLSSKLKPEDLFQFDLKPTGPPTVTIRNSPKHPKRNSDPQVWLPFAQEIGAKIIPDAWANPISVKERFDLYRYSPVNYFANNGPGAAAIYSNLPAVMVNDVSQGALRWIPEGTQYPFSTEKQRMLWGEITLEKLREEHKSWKSNL